MSVTLSDSASNPSRSLRNRLGDAFVDQLLNVASNFPVLLLIARYADAAGRELGLASIALLLQTLTIGIAGAAGIEALTILRSSGVERDVQLEREQFTVSVLLAIALSAAGWIVMVAVWSASGEAVIIFLVTPVMVAQRHLRLHAHVLDQHRRAAVDSAVWLVVSSIVLLGVALRGLTVNGVLIAWSAGACAALLWQLATWDFARDLRFVRPRRASVRVSSSLAAEFSIDRGALDIIGLYLAATFGVIFAGEMRLALTYFGLANLVVGSAVPTLLEETRRRTTFQAAQSLRSFIVSVSVGTALVPAGVAAVIWGIGSGRLETLLGPSAVGAMALLPWIALRQVSRNLANGPVMLLRVTLKTRESRRLRLVATPVLAGACVIAANSVGGEATLAIVGVASLVLVLPWATLAAWTLRDLKYAPPLGTGSAGRR